MDLPNFDKAFVPPAKITGYLLSTTHWDGRHKAVFFMRHGFAADRWQELADALLNHARVHAVIKQEPSPFGTRFVVEGRMNSPDGRNPMVRSVWFIDTVGDSPRFVTAYPREGESDV